MPDKNYQVVLSLSGGLDSGVLLSDILRRRDIGPENVACLNFQYRSKHNIREANASYHIARHYGVSLFTMSPGSCIDTKGDSALVNYNSDVPSGHYNEETMKQTVVPGRNLVFIAVLASFAESFGVPRVFLGVHAGDHFIYPDCRPEFILSAAETIKQSTEGKVLLQAPFLTMSKQEIVKIGLANGFPFWKSWTCYRGGKISCGTCGSCQERLEAFHLNGAEDPLEYETRELIPKKSDG